MIGSRRRRRKGLKQARSLIFQLRQCKFKDLLTSEESRALSIGLLTACREGYEEFLLAIPTLEGVIWSRYSFQREDNLTSLNYVVRHEAFYLPHPDAEGVLAPPKVDKPCLILDTVLR